MARSVINRMSLAAGLAMSLVIAGCALPSRGPALTLAQSHLVQVAGIPNSRFMLADVEQLRREFVASTEREVAYRQQAGLTGPLPPAAFLAISGGGDDGAYGAGLLAGWTARGDRPNFKAVTGISTGALTAPFAFLGSGADPELRDVYTQSTAKRIFKPRGRLAALFSDAMGDTGPLRDVVRGYVDDQMIAQIADEYRKGRLLLIMTTNLDVGEPCVWNIGAIAASGHPQARELIVKILMASAAIPAAFPPVMIDFQVDGRRMQEMHVDGGVIAQVFLYPPSISLADGPTVPGAEGRQRDAYIIRNGRLKPASTDVKRRTIKIAGRAVSVMIATAGVNDMIRLYATTSRDGVGYHLAYIGDEFTVPYKGPFDRGYMSTLFQFGFEQGRRGDGWARQPPYWAK